MQTLKNLLFYLFIYIISMYLFSSIFNIDPEPFEAFAVLVSFIGAVAFADRIFPDKE